jgi:hypothetical protein
MKRRRAGRTGQQRQRKRYPFTESTKIIELVRKKHYGDVVKLIERLNPFLMDGGKGAFLLTGLFFDLEKVNGKRQFVIDVLALFLKKLKDENGLKCKQNIFFRYLSCPEHCNLAFSENSLKALILDAIRRRF